MKLKKALEKRWNRWGAMRLQISAAFVVLLIALAPALAETPAKIEGRAIALDGGTLQMGDTRVRLHGIDAPEMRSRYGPFARAYLDDLIAGKTVTCIPTDKDRFGRKVARCRTAKGDLGAAMVRAGWATSYRRFSTEYDAAERAARAAGQGLWADAPRATVGIFAWVKRWEVLIGFLGLIAAALIAFSGVIWAALYNGRAARNMERERRADEASAVASAIGSEIAILAYSFAMDSSVLFDSIKPEVSIGRVFDLVRRFPPLVFTENVGKLGLLGGHGDQGAKAVAAIVIFYDVYALLTKSIDDYVKEDQTVTENTLATFRSLVNATLVGAMTATGRLEMIYSNVKSALIQIHWNEITEVIERTKKKKAS